MNDSQVVVVEDDPNVSALISHALRRESIAVETAASIASARERLSRPWDLVLLDRYLPDGDGVELCHDIRPTNPHGYIMIITGEATKEAKLAGFGCGADDYVTKPFAIEELVARVRAGLRIVDLQKRLLDTNAKLEKLSRTDPLTSLANRRTFDRELATRFEHAKRYGRPLSLAMIDVDHFKQVNDTFGHQAGDEVLRRIAMMLKGTTRASDCVTRYGGEEFAVILPEAQMLEALQFADKVRATIAAESFGPAITRRMTVSVGLACTAQSRFAEPSGLIRAADAALYRAKANGRNRVECERRSAEREVAVVA